MTITETWQTNQKYGYYARLHSDTMHECTTPLSRPVDCANCSKSHNEVIIPCDKSNTDIGQRMLNTMFHVRNVRQYDSLIKYVLLDLALSPFISRESAYSL